MINFRNSALLFLCIVTFFTLFSQDRPNTDDSKFRQLGTVLPTPNTYRNAAGAPGHQYWQQRADYDIKVELDDEKQKISGTETITYSNNSPDKLSYIWIQLDQNIEHKESATFKSLTGTLADKGKTDFNKINTATDNTFEGGFQLQYVKDGAGKPLKYTINNTMMRVDMPTALSANGGKIVFQIGWSYNIADRENPATRNSRGGYDYFEEDKNYLYTITQWFPRMAVYDDYNGWQHKQFLGSGEFTLPFGNYSVAITVPSDHVIAATGVLQNPSQVLTAKQMSKFEQAKTATKPVVIISQEDAVKNEKAAKAKTKKTWNYKAENVRDFAFGSSRKFIWDAMGVDIAGKKVMAMSYYPKEANPLYGQLSTEAVAHTLRTYSKYTIPYPYPTAISVEASNGMEYPMICFNYGRPDKDSTYSERIKFGMLGVIIHEVGHNFFPMIINSDERQWTWMDEGLNSFVECLAETEWQRDFPIRAYPKDIVNYMKADRSVQNPIMTNSESIIQFGANAYSKPAAALMILRETIMGRELFDFAFKTYAQRWAFKHPTPSDFFRTMEDASGMDLDWFWRGWFYTTDHVDISLDRVTEFKLDTKNPEIEKPLAVKKLKDNLEKQANWKNNKKDNVAIAVEKNAAIRDFYNLYDPTYATKSDREAYKKYISSLDSITERPLFNSSKRFYQLDFSNKGGLVMPLILEFEFEDGTKETQKIPAEVWRMNDAKISKVFAFDKPVKQVSLDPNNELADADMENNFIPRKFVPSRFEIFKQSGGVRGQSQGETPMQIYKKEGLKPGEVK